MKKSVISRTLIGAALIATPLTGGFAQGWAPGSEIAGHSVQVETNGVVNTVYFGHGGTARIQTPGGSSVDATWSVANNQLCLQTATGQECWPYNSPFQAGQQMTLTSSCAVASRWLPLSTSQPPVQAPMGERG